MTGNSGSSLGKREAIMWSCRAPLGNSCYSEPGISGIRANDSYPPSLLLPGMYWRRWVSCSNY